KLFATVGIPPTSVTTRCAIRRSFSVPTRPLNSTTRSCTLTVMSLASRPRCSDNRSRTRRRSSLSLRSSTSSMFSKSCAIPHLTMPLSGVPGWGAPLSEEKVRHAQREPDVTRPVARRIFRSEHARPVAGSDVVRVRVLDLVQLIAHVGADLHVPGRNPLHPTAKRKCKRGAESPRADIRAALEVGRYPDASVYERHDATITALASEVERDPDVRRVYRPRRIVFDDPLICRAPGNDHVSLRLHIRKLRRESCWSAKSEIVTQPDHRSAPWRDASLVGSRVVVPAEQRSLLPILEVEEGPRL